MRKLFIIPLVSVVILTACQSTQPKLDEEEVVKKSDTNFIISRVNSDINMLKRMDLSNNNTMGDMIFERLCTITGKEMLDGRALYVEDFFSTNGNPVICSEKLATLVVKDRELANVVHVRWMKSVYSSLEAAKRLIKKGVSPDTFKAELDKYEKYNKQIKAVVDLEQHYKDIERKKNHPRVWVMKTSFDEFNEETTKSMTLKDNYNLSLECRINKNNDKNLSITWRIKSVIATPATSLSFIAIVNGKPLKLEAFTYSNSYRSGYVPRIGNIGFDSVVEQLITRKKFNYRLQSKRKSKVIDGYLLEADSTKELKSFIEGCS